MLRDHISLRLKNMLKPLAKTGSLLRSKLWSIVLIRRATTLFTAGSLAIGGLATVPIVAPCSTATWADHHSNSRRGERYYGDDARDGRDGVDGRNGRDGENRTISLPSGFPIQLELSGEAGEDGRDGEDAERRRCARQPRNTRYDLQAADGGDGGDGGNGGRGGNGGTVTVYYADPVALRQVYVNAIAGRGGDGGRGGNGVRGCNCDDDSWRIKRCTEDGNCTDERYECEDGDDGDYGQGGRGGAAGNTGRLVAINQLEPLPAETPAVTTAIATLADQTISLSRNLWQTRSGARNLLAPGSNISDSYQAYTGHIERQFALDWQAPQSANSLRDNVTVSLLASGDVGIQFPEDYWLQGSSTKQADVTTYRVDGIIPVAQVTQLAMGRVAGRSRTFEVNVIDRARLSESLDTAFRIRYSTARDRGTRTRYTVQHEGPIPSDLIVRDNNRFTLALGRLPIRSQLMSGGTQARVEIIATRRYGENSKQQTITWTGRL